jgi:pimeloyl-ACP methyl ester carboxylesterase
VPDLPGFGRTTAPKELEAYSYKSVIEDLVAIVKHVQGEQHEGEKIVLGGQDWGGAVVWYVVPLPLPSPLPPPFCCFVCLGREQRDRWNYLFACTGTQASQFGVYRRAILTLLHRRFAQWHPELLKCVFSVCTPFVPVNEVYYTKEQIAQIVPSLAYQVQLAGTAVDEAVVGRDKIGAFLRGMYGGAREDGQAVFDVAKGVDLALLEADKIGPSPLLSGEEMDYYVEEYAPNGMRGPLCWYKTARVNFDEEKQLLEEGRMKVAMPALFIAASRDDALPPALAAGMGQFCTDLVKKEVDSSHWALWEAAAETNRHIVEFLEPLLKGQSLKASI